MESKTAWIEQEIAQLKAQGLFTQIRTVQSPQGAWLTVDGKRVLNLSSNNYLGLASDPRLVEAARRAMDRYRRWQVMRRKNDWGERPESPNIQPKSIFGGLLPFGGKKPKDKESDKT